MRSATCFSIRSAIAAFALGLAPSVASAQATLMTGLGGARGYGTNCMPPNDDGSYPLSGSPGMDLTPAFPSGLHFYTGTYTRGWINNNGSLSFNSAISTFTPSAFPGSPQPMIAPYWADTDTRSGSECSSASYPIGGAYPPGTACMNPATDGVWWSLTPGQLVITWDNVGFYNCHTTPTMAYQMILTSVSGCGTGASGMDFDVEFRYATCGWETGDASGGTGGFGGTPAQAGFDSSPTPAPETYQSLPGSRTAAINTNLCTMSNVTPPSPGVWRFGVRGGMIMCPDAGMPCSTGLPGVCAMGQLSCTGTSMTTCVPFTMAGASQCNGLDNDCDGTIDTGPCPTGEVCDGSECVPMCVEGACFAGQTCTSSGLCEDTSCIGVTCPAGERCMGGTCGDPCTGVVCPMGQICRLGGCVDPCAGLDCGMGQVCEAGMCVASCPCMMCSATQTCTSDGHCVDTPCATMTCAAGEVCTAGSCVDACTGAICPTGQMCMTGMCVPSPVTDAGAPDSGVPYDAGMSDNDGSSGGDASTGDATLRDGSGGGDGARGDAHGDGGHGATSAGCACRASGTGAGGATPWLRGIVGLGIAVALSRRRRR